MNKDSLGDRMKRNYEDVTRYHLTRRMPVVGRIDGKAFHTLTRGMNKPFDHKLIYCMWYAAQKLCEEIQGCKLAYVQSDEISVLLTDYDDLQTERWFAGNLQKMASVAASTATYYFSQRFRKEFPDTEAPTMFDARFFTIPKEEVSNYFIWRQQDATRNSVSMLAQACISHKDLQGVSSAKAQDLLIERHNINWNDLPVYLKRGACVVKTFWQQFHPQWDHDDEIWMGEITKLPDQVLKKVGIEHPPEIIRDDSNWYVDFETPIFSADRYYIENHI